MLTFHRLGYILNINHIINILYRNGCLLIFILSLLCFDTLENRKAYAHPGNTASDGCHYCRTNCDKWGVPWNARHCHGGSSAPADTYYNNPQPSCPSNSSYNTTSKSCVCSTGYTPSLDKNYCVKIPQNAHAVISTTDVWECNEGYGGANGACVKTSVPVINRETRGVPTAPVTQTTGSTSTGSSSEDDGTLASLLVLGGIGTTAYLINKKRKGKISNE